MTIQQQIKIDLMGAMKAKDEDKKSTLRVIMGEFARADAKELSDDEVIKVLKKLINSEKEIVAWVRDNIDLSQFKSKMQAMGPIMKHFGAQADGNVVKNILQGL